MHALVMYTPSPRPTPTLATLSSPRHTCLYLHVMPCSTRLQMAVL